MMKITEKQKEEVAMEILNIINFHLKAYNLPMDPAHISLATTLFQEGVKYIPGKFTAEGRE